MQIRSRPRLMRKLGVIGAVLCGGLLLGGCTQPDPKPIPTAPPTAAGPVFASDEEALAAAEAGYQAYLDAWNEIAMEGGVDPARILPLIYTAQQQDTLDGLAKFSDRSVHNSDEVTAADFRLEGYQEATPGIASVSIYVCLDYSGSRVIDEFGNDVTIEGRRDLLPVVERLISSSDDHQDLLYAGGEIWTAENFCR